MSWPAEKNLRVIDLSRYNRADAGPEINFTTLKEKNPGLKGVITRVAGSTSGADPAFQHNFDQAILAGFDVGAYVVIWPAQDLEVSFGVWDIVLGGRKPKVIWADVELTGGKSADFVRGYVREALIALENEYPWATIGVYTADWFWRPNVGDVSWAEEFPLWVAHYLYENPSEKKLYTAFNSFEATLPYSSASTPRLPPGWPSAVGWQFSSAGELAPIMPRKTDLNLFDPAWWNERYRPEPPPTVHEKLIRVRSDSPITVEILEDEP